jgi:hypothetical protein
MSLSDFMGLVDTLDVPTLAAGVLYGFWKVIHVLTKIEREITEHLHAHDIRIVKLEAKAGST